MKINFEGVTKETILRTVVLLVALLNQVFAMLGKGIIPITDEEIYQYGTLILTALSSIWAWWKNNSFTKEAQACDVALKELRNVE